MFMVEPTIIVLGGKDSAEVKFEEPAKLDPDCGPNPKIV
jgi:hypothetical protein